MSKQITVKVNEEYRSLVPRPTKQEYNALRESIMINGQQEPISINRYGYILDGHTRYEILSNMGRETRYTIKHFSTKAQEILYVVDANIMRRQLNAYQKVETAKELWSILVKMARRGRSQKSLLDGTVRSVFARKLGMGMTVANQAKILSEEAPERLKKKLRNGSISISAAYSLHKRKIESPRKVRAHKTYLNKDTIVQCPSCSKEFRRGDLIVSE